MSETGNAAIHQYTAVAIDGRGVLLAGPPGCGKSSMALSLIDRGAALIGDDGVELTVTDGALIASPVSETRGLLEIRNVGIVSLDCTSAPVALVVRFDDDAPRYIEPAPVEMLMATPVPHLAMHVSGHAAPIRIEQALRLHGLQFGSTEKDAESRFGGFSNRAGTRRGEA